MPMHQSRSTSRGGAPRITPTERKAAHEARDEKRRERRDQRYASPGPGAYEAKEFMGKTEKRASSAFRSSTKRSDNLGEIKGQGDPGAYFPDKGTDLGKSAVKSFSKSSREGKQAFGTKQKRSLKLVGEDALPTDTPGPGAYNSTRPEKAVVNGSTTVFKSRSAKAVPVRNAHTPSPSAYDVRDGVTRPDVTNAAGHSLASKGPRTLPEASASATDVEVGPGTYDAPELFTSKGKHTTVAGFLQSQIDGGSIQGSAAFTNELSRMTPRQYAPGVLP